MNPNFAHVNLLTRPQLDVAWISVTKCGSAFIRQVLRENNWFEPSDEVSEAIRRSRDIPKMIVLRDPVQRWISGFSECFSKSPAQLKILDLLDNETFWDTIAVNPVFDGHTEFQHRFYRGAANTQYIYMQTNHPAQEFYTKLAVWMRKYDCVAEFDRWRDPANSYENDPIKQAINLKLKDLVRSKYKEMLTELHNNDYKLLDQLPKLKL